LKKLWNLAHEVFSQTSSSYSTTSFHSEVILAQTRQNFNEACKYMELNNIRDYVHLVFFENLRLIENYQKIAASLHLKERNHVSAHILRIMVIYLTPIIPHICEELAEKYKLISTNNTFISNVEIPKVKLEEEDEHLIDQNNFLNNFLDDVEQIIRMTNIHPKKIFVYLPFEWKQRLYEELQAEFQDQSLSVPKIMQFCKNSAYLKPYMKEIAKESQFLSQHSEFIRINLLSLESQVLSIQESLAYLQLKYSDVELEIIFPELKGTKKTMETSAQAQKAKKTRPMKPALYIE
jgi:leucyl-tRNA synthetase